MEVFIIDVAQSRNLVCSSKLHMSSSSPLSWEGWNFLQPCFDIVMLFITYSNNYHYWVIEYGRYSILYMVKFDLILRRFWKWVTFNSTDSNDLT